MDEPECKEPVQPEEPVTPKHICEQCSTEITTMITKKIGGQEKDFCSEDCVNLFKTNIEAQRVTSEERMGKDINFLNREIEYKKDQLKNGITETRAINQVPGQPAMILDGYKDGLKPDYIIKNEIEKDKQRIKEKRRALEDIKIAREEDASKPN